MEEGGKKTSGNRSINNRKKGSRSKCMGKRNMSSLSRRRKKKSLAKLVSQNSIDDVHCFPIPFADFFCGCGKDCGKDKNKIKRISSKQLLSVGKTKKPSSKKIEKDNVEKCSHQEEVKIEDKTEVVEKEEKNEAFNKEDIPVAPSDAFGGFTESLDFDKLKLNGNMKNLLANVKFTSIFGCSNVPRTMSQIKILLDNNPGLKTQLRHILGDNLKNENMKPVAELLASDKEINADDLSNDSSIRRLSISKSYLEMKKDCIAESVNSSFIMSKKGGVTCKSRKESDIIGQGSMPRSKKTCRKGSTRRSNGSESQMSLFAKIFSSVFRPTKPSKSKRKKHSTTNAGKTPKKNFPQCGDSSVDCENMKEMREKYDEWFKRSPEEVRERFRWEDYVRVTKYLDDIREASSNNDEKAKEMLNLWLTKFNKEINRSVCKEDVISENFVVGNESFDENNITGRKLKRIVSEEMLNAGGGDVIRRLNSLMKELVESTENCDEKPHADAGGDVEEDTNQDPPLPGCSKWFEHGVANVVDGAGKDSTTTDEVSIYQMMCASFVDKLSKHGSKESKSILGSRYASEMPWQNKDFQVFYVPTIQTRYTLDNLCNRRGYGYFEEREKSVNYDTESSSEEQENTNTTGEESQVSSETRETDISSKSENKIIKMSETKCDIYKTNGDLKMEESKISHPKKVSFNDNLSHDNYESLDNETPISTSVKNSLEDTRSINDQNEDIEVTNVSENHYVNTELSSAVTTCSSLNSDINYILQNSVNDDEQYKERRETIKYIKDHKCELVDILKYLLSLANQSPSILESNTNIKAESELSKAKTCVGIQCKISEEITGKNINNSDSSIKRDSLASFQHLLKCQSESRPKKVGSESESLASDNIKLISSLSDSGVHSNSSSTCHRRQFISLPDVLEGAPVVLGGEIASSEACKQESVGSMKMKGSSSSNLLASCLSTSVSCQASQAPDIDNFSQASASDLSETQCRVLETRSTTTFKHATENNSSSEKSRSSENTRSCPEIQEVKPSRIRIKNIFRRKTIKGTKKL